MLSLIGQKDEIEVKCEYLMSAFEMFSECVEGVVGLLSRLWDLQCTQNDEGEGIKQSKKNKKKQKLLDKKAAKAGVKCKRKTLLDIWKLEEILPGMLCRLITGEMVADNKGEWTGKILQVLLSQRIIDPLLNILSR